VLGRPVPNRFTRRRCQHHDAHSYARTTTVYLCKLVDTCRGASSGACFLHSSAPYPPSLYNYVVLFHSDRERRARTQPQLGGAQLARVARGR
jgi:hypothetical protein